MFQDGNMVLDIKLETTKGLGISLVYISLVIKQHAHSSFTLVACQDEVLIRYVGTTHRGPSRSLLTRGVCIRCNSSEADEIEDRMAHSPSSSHMNSC
jgi:hypothetical protein